MAPSLITTKLMVPRPPQTVVERPRLQEQLAAGLKRKLILVSAPAGSGKSTLLASWLIHGDTPVAWLSLDANDNDLERFFVYFVHAFQPVVPTITLDVKEVLQNQQAIQANTVLTQLINTINRLNQRLILVLDDYHVIANPQIHQAIAFLLDYLPDQLCLIIATRSDPPLALSRLRVRREIIEIRSGQLRFSLEETALLLNDHLQLHLSPHSLSKLEKRTEGWAAGLQLAALSLAGRRDKAHFIDNFAGNHHYLVDYLMEEVLQRQTPQVRQFLERTAILDRFTAPLCEVLTEQKDSAGILRKLSSANLFLIPLDDERQWYRYHHLFAEFLRLHLKESQCHIIPQLHRRASEWFEKEGWSDEAIQHALIAQDFRRAGQLVENIGFKLGVTWNNAQLIKYAGQLPLALLPELPRLCIYYGWALINTGRVESLGALITVIERNNQHTDASRALSVALLNFRTCLLSWQLEFPQAIALCQEALDILESNEAEYSDEERWLRVATTNLLAYNYLQSDLPKAEAFYPVTFALAKRFTSFAGTVNRYGRFGRVKHQLGKLEQARDILHEGFEALERWKAMPNASVINEGELHVSLARLHYEWNRLDETRTHLEKASQFNQHSQFPPLLALELETAARFHLARGDLEGARISLVKLDQMINQAHPDNLLYKHMFGVMSMNLRLCLFAVSREAGLLEKVQDWVNDYQLTPDDPFNYAHEARYLVLSRLLLAQGKVAEAVKLLERLHQAANAEGRIENQLRYQILQALGYHTLNQKSQALLVLADACELGKAQGFCRIFVDEGPVIQSLLEQLAQRQESPYLQKLLSAFPPTAIEISPNSPPVVTQRVRPEAPWIEPLSERELRVLQLLASGNSNKEISKALELSPNTVRWYVSNILSKLGVSSRLEAVARARELGLV